jgi:predicted transposase YbfD/YdcC
MAKPPPQLQVLTIFHSLADPRRHQGKVVHSLEALLLIALAGTLCGNDDWDSLALFAEDQLDWLRSVLPSVVAAPSADTLRRVFERLNPKVFADCLTTWMRSLASHLEGTIALDGKSVHGAVDPAKRSVPLHLMHAWSCKARLLLGVERVEGAPGEPSAIPAVLRQLELAGLVVTGDANQTSRATAQYITERNGDYLLALKGNRGPLFAKVVEYFAPRVDTGLGTGGFGATPVRYAIKSEKGHGRLETRQGWVVAAREVPEIAAHFPRVRSLLCMDRTRVHKGEVSTERVYFVSSLRPNVTKQMRIAREHWSIENHLHRALDVVFHEDESKIRFGAAAENMAMLRRMALELVKRDTSYPKRSLRQRIKTVARVPRFLLDLIRSAGQ